MSESNPDYITVSLLGSGYAALHMTWDSEAQFYDVQQTGIGRYETRDKAETEARSWSISDQIELRI